MENQCKICLHRKELEIVNEFRCLGVKFSKDDREEAEDENTYSRKKN